MPCPPFDRRATEPQSFVGKLLRRQPKRNALVALNNALCAAPTLAEIPRDLVERISDEHGVELRREYAGELAALYRDALGHFISDHRLSDNEAADLSRLAALFGLAPDVQRAIHEELAGPIYRDVLRRVLSDHSFTDSEKQQLAALKAALRLSDASEAVLFREASHAALQDLANRLTSDNRMSPQEDRELERFAAELGATIKQDAESESALQKMRRYWTLENDSLDTLTVEVPINLQRNELCVFSTRCQWLERRQQTERIRYGGPAVSLRIMKGVYYRAGDYRVERVSREVMATVDEGSAYLTSKRLIFVGVRKSFTLTLTRILDFTPYRDGIELVKGSGKNPILSFTDRLDEFGLLLGRLIQQSA